MTSSNPFGQQLLEKRHIHTWQLESALAHKERWGGRLDELLVDMGFVSERVVLAELALELNVPYVDLDGLEVPAFVVRLVPERLIRARKVFPVRAISHAGRALLVVATRDPMDLQVLDEVAFATGRKVKAVLAGKRALERATARYFGESAVGPAVPVELPTPPEGPMHVLTFAESVQ